jgi:hypothetical protein
VRVMTAAKPFFTTMAIGQGSGLDLSHSQVQRPASPSFPPLLR